MPWRRVASWSIDGAVVIGVVAVASSVSGTLGAVMLVVGAPAYYVLSVGRPAGGTVGHALTGLAVRDVHTGQPIDRWRAAIRCVVGLGLFVPFAIPAVISGVSVFRDLRARAWHDFASDSVVVMRPRTAGPGVSS